MPSSGTARYASGSLFLLFLRADRFPRWLSDGRCAKPCPGPGPPHAPHGPGRVTRTACAATATQAILPPDRPVPLAGHPAPSTAAAARPVFCNGSDSKSDSDVSSAVFVVHFSDVRPSHFMGER
ncbi:hypothetical protein Stsp01_16480 [Streptomyces sp. NBRC 13847]|nr:hypothetical protein Stsp01_16480 [Streptomyces sp. NBRC 13847]